MGCQIQGLVTSDLSCVAYPMVPPDMQTSSGKSSPTRLVSVGDSLSTFFHSRCCVHVVLLLSFGFSYQKHSSPGKPMMTMSVQPSWLMSAAKANMFLE